jgi:hypothetical protein
LGARACRLIGIKGCERLLISKHEIATDKEVYLKDLLSISVENSAKMSNVQSNFDLIYSRKAQRSMKDKTEMQLCLFMHDRVISSLAH